MTQKEGWLHNLIESYGHAIMYIIMSIIYGIIAGIVFVAGYFLSLTTETTLMNIVNSLPEIDFGDSVITLIAVIIMLLGVLLFLLGGLSAFLFTATRNDRIAVSISFFKGYGVSIKNLLSFLLILFLFGGAYFAVDYFVSGLPVTIVMYVVAVIYVLTPVAMIFRIIDYILEMNIVPR